MYDLVLQKFKLNPKIRKKLIATDGSPLIEGNTWHDCIWGTCTCTMCGGKGLNWLGRILMHVRDALIYRARLRYRAKELKFGEHIGIRGITDEF
jgi:predicted NAD-dependent protein-ADP-ribosyltransferase YbiA (DUF1768 family)